MRIHKFLFTCIIAVSALVFSGHSHADVPFADTIERALSAVSYSGYHIIIKPDVKLNIDFDAQTWTLRNAHAYDEQGRLMLEQGKYGLCAELATHIYNEIVPLIEQNEYELKFANAIESDFFSSSQSNHIVLVMKARDSQKTYLLDPSFHKFGLLSDFKEYKLLGIQDSLAFMRGRSPDIVFKRDQAMPLFIKNDRLVSFAVTSVDGKFDRNNFLFVVSVNERLNTDILDVQVLGKKDGQIREVRRSKMLEELFNPEEFIELYRKMSQWLLEML